ncbi:MAG: hypothetical protein H0Z33_04900 [Bacillaceae bacterium]|nr:hypothetical protein [Bacillaceae bacterium]
MKCYVVSLVASVYQDLSKWLDPEQIILMENVPDQPDPSSSILYIAQNRADFTVIRDLDHLTSYLEQGIHVAVLLDDSASSDEVKRAVEERNIPVIRNGRTRISECKKHLNLYDLDHATPQNLCVFSPLGGVGKSLIACHLAMKIGREKEVNLIEWNPFTASFSSYFSLRPDSRKGINALLHDLRHGKSISNLETYQYQKGMLRILPAELDWVDVEKWRATEIEEVWKWLQSLPKEQTIITDIPSYPQFAPSWYAFIHATDLIIPFHPLTHHVDIIIRFLDWLQKNQIDTRIHFILLQNTGSLSLPVSQVEKFLDHKVVATLSEGALTEIIQGHDIRSESPLNSLLELLGFQSVVDIDSARRFWPLKKTG